MKLKFHRYCIQYFQLNVHVRRQLFFYSSVPAEVVTIAIVNYTRHSTVYTAIYRKLHYNKHGCYRNNMQYQKLQ